MTHRQFVGWVAWEAEQWNRPSRTDHELQAIRLELVRMFAENPRSITADDVKLEFVETKVVSEKDKPKPETAEEFSRRAAAAWGAFIKGVKGRKDERRPG